MTPRERFLGLLKNDILKLDLAELNFGVYRILNARRDLVLKFLDHELPALIETQLAQLPGAATEDEEARIYAALDTFFHRYWDDGDFILRPRRGRDAAYSVPYDGSDVYFHWATKGSHYVKSGEFLKSYAFKPEGAGGEVRFEITAAQQEKDNVKGAKRYFVPAGKAQHGAALVIRFEYRPLTEAEAKKYDIKGSKVTDGGNGDDSNGAAAGQLAPGKTQHRLLRAWLDGADFKSASVPAALHGAAFDRHVARYVRKHTSDFFVHPRLGPFLEGELDYFLKNEFLQIWDRETPEALARERAKFNIVRGIGKRIIAFLHQIEDFQARLFEKRKFILKTDWLVMASALAAREGGKALVEKAAANKQQAAEWRGWVGDDALSGKKLLENYPHLPIHTVHFDETFVLGALGCFEDVEAELGGVLVHGENYAALRTIEMEYKERVQCSYIDPPYNTGNDEFLYKDDFNRHGAWLSMLQRRYALSKQVMSPEASIATSIDENELCGLRLMLEEIFGTESLVAQIIWKKRSTPPNDKPIGAAHEYIVLTANQPFRVALNYRERGEKQLSRFRNLDNHPKGPWAAGDLMANIKGGRYVASLNFPIVNPDTGVEHWPSSNGNWRFSKQTIERLLANNEIYFGEDGKGRPKLKRFLAELKEGMAYTTLWDFVPLNTQGSAEMAAIFGSMTAFENPKPVGLVQEILRMGGGESCIALDFFAGSGTTGQAVIDLNRVDGGCRRFVLVEQGEYFDRLVVPRISRIMCCPEWGQGKPNAKITQHAEDDDHWSRRTLPLVKVLRIERYEDSLDALETRDEFEARRAGMREMAGADYTLRYLLEEETRGSALFAPGRLFEAPFSAQLPVHTPGGVKLVNIDLAESTLAMLGLRLVRVFEDTFEKRRYRMMSARTRGDELQLVVLRDLTPAPETKFWEREYRWLAKTVEARWGRKLATYARIWYNGDTMLLDNEAGSSIDAEFARVMQERDPHATAG